MSGMFAEYERRKAATRVRKRHFALKERRLPVAGPPPFG